MAFAQGNCVISLLEFFVSQKHVDKSNPVDIICSRHTDIISYCHMILCTSYIHHTQKAFDKIPHERLETNLRGHWIEAPSSYALKSG